VKVPRLHLSHRLEALCLDSDQAILDLDVLANCMNLLRLCESIVPLPQTPSRDPTLRGGDLTTIDLDALV
jgi:hypothetical protein